MALTTFWDGGNISPCAEHYLGWLHNAMRFIVLGQFVKGLAHHEAKEAAALEERLVRIKWRLWHRDGREAQIRLDILADDIGVLECVYPNLQRIAKITTEFATYIRNNVSSIPTESGGAMAR